MFPRHKFQVYIGISAGIFIVEALNKHHWENAFHRFMIWTFVFAILAFCAGRGSTRSSWHDFFSMFKLSTLRPSPYSEFKAGKEAKRIAKEKKRFQKKFLKNPLKSYKMHTRQGKKKQTKG